MELSATASLADAIDAVLPQTQCTKCGYAGCRPYAEAIADNAADINQCPPGGSEGIASLARLLQRSPLPLNPGHGREGPLSVAVINEALCIGCTLCIQACPVDCIVGARKRMHSVLASQCTGCELCVAPCPTDCITLSPLEPSRRWTRNDAAAARERYEQRNARRAIERTRRDARLAAATPQAPGEVVACDEPDAAERARKKTIVDAAVARARARRAALADRGQ